MQKLTTILFLILFSVTAFGQITRPKLKRLELAPTDQYYTIRTDTVTGEQNYYPLDSLISSVCDSCGVTSIQEIINTSDSTVAIILTNADTLEINFNDGDSVTGNEWNLNFEIDTINNLLTITDGGGALSVPYNLFNVSQDTTDDQVLFWNPVTFDLSIEDANLVNLGALQDGNGLFSLANNFDTIRVNNVALPAGSMTWGAIEPFSSLRFLPSRFDVQIPDLSPLNRILLQRGATSEFALTPFAGFNTARITGEMVQIVPDTFVINSINDYSLPTMQPTGGAGIYTLAVDENGDFSTSDGWINLNTFGGGSGVDLDSLVNLELVGTEIIATLQSGATQTVNLSPIISAGGGDVDSLVSLSLIGTTLRATLQSGQPVDVDLSALQDGVIDADSDPTNELQQLELIGDTLSITNGNSVDLTPLIGGGGSDGQGIETITVQTDAGAFVLDSFNNVVTFSGAFQPVNLTPTQLITTAPAGNTVEFSLNLPALDGLYNITVLDENNGLDPAINASNQLTIQHDWQEFPISDPITAADRIPFLNINQAGDEYTSTMPEFATAINPLLNVDDNDADPTNELIDSVYVSSDSIIIVEAGIEHPVKIPGVSVPLEYTPTITPIGNIGTGGPNISPSNQRHFYYVFGDIVFVEGYFETVQYFSPETRAFYNISLPIPSTISSAGQLIGSAESTQISVGTGVSIQSGIIHGDSTVSGFVIPNEAVLELTLTNPGIGEARVTYKFSYKIIP